MTLWGRLALVLCGGAALLGCGRSDLYDLGRCQLGDPACATQTRNDGGVDARDDGRGGGNGGHGGGAGGGRDGGGGEVATCAAAREICDNGRDDNCNGLSDCDDPACLGAPVCITPGLEICNNGLDDDGDGLIDCADPDCSESIACRPTVGKEICDNGVDDNGDGLVDCADPQCTQAPSCLTVDCQPQIHFGTIAVHGADVSASFDTSASMQTYATCATPGGHGQVGDLTLTATTDLRLDFTQAAGTAHVVSLFRAGANQACDQNPVFCVAAGQQPTATHTFPSLAPGVYRVVVQSYPGTEGSSQVRLSTGTAATEICNNGIDDDMNGLVDCQDAACFSSPLCVGQECVPDVNVGALVVGADPKSVVVDTSTSTDRYHPTCAGTSHAGDRAVEFTLVQSGGVRVQFSQMGDHVISFFRMPGPGLACDAMQIDCDYLGTLSTDFALNNLSPGQYLFIAKATSPDKTGMIKLQFSAFGNKPVEICDNHIDDDNNGLTDCDDPACAGVGACTHVACVPDMDLGSFSWGTSETLSLDLTTGRNLYQTTCGKGDGKEKVLRLKLTQPMALGLECTQSPGSSQVFQLSSQLNPLDPCDANNFNCGDPQVLPFGCAYAMPNLQPGTYNLIVQAFQAGTEGQVTLRLTGLQETVREICNNGIDDDGDGAIDCNDLKCVTDPSCAKLACRSDQSLGLLPLDGSTQSVVLKTSMAGDDEATAMCVSAPGGQDAVVDFQLPALSDLTLQWAQVGNHVLALYTNGGTLLACEASPEVACVPTGGQTTGTKVLSGLAAGRYHLVVDADKPGSEGGVVLQVSAVASPPMP
jgi:hypothetical protein